jgi:hypothetical protein
MEPTVKEVKHLKCVFYKNISAEGGAMLQAINKANDTDVILHSQTTKLGRMWGYTNTTNFLKLLEKNNGLYEVITKFPHKVYFDIDEDEKQENVCEYIEKVKHIILTYFPNAEMAISGSNTETKSSLHIILNNYTIHNEAERIYMRQLVKYISLNVLASFDWKVYTKNRNMKCINQGKLDGRLQEIIENTDCKAHCITNFLNDYCLPFPGLNYEIEESILIEKSNYHN